MPHAAHVDKINLQDWKMGDWKATMESVEKFKESKHKNDGDAWSVIFLGKDENTNYKRQNAVKNV